MSVNEHGNLTHGVTLHDVLRNLVRGRWPNTEYNQQQALLAIDAHEQGYPDSGAWQEELKRRADALATPQPASEGETPDEKIARLEAQVARSEALLHAQTGPAAQPTKPSAPKE